MTVSGCRRKQAGVHLALAICDIAPAVNQVQFQQPPKHLAPSRARTLSGVPLQFADSPATEFAFQLPCLAIRLQGLAEPVKRVRLDLGVPPASRRAIGSSAQLYDVLPVASADLLLAVARDGINPGDAK